MRSLAVTLGIAIMAAPCAWAAGGRTHAEMGLHAWRDYLHDVEPMLPGLGDFLANDEVRHAYFSGCTFPDWGYNAGINRDASEDSHWAPFLEAYFQVLKEKYPPPWNEEVKKRLAFFFGVVTHDMTDLPWHFTDGRGPRSDHVAFEDRAAQEEKQGHADYDMACHIFTEMDFGPLPGMQADNGPRRLWFPYDDILAAFARQGVTVTRQSLETGAQNLTAFSNLTVYFGGIPYISMRDKYPWARVHYKDYYYGGIEHGAALTAMWVRYWYARLHGWHYYQDMPDYARKPPEYVPYLGCEDVSLCKKLPDNNTGSEPWLELGGGDDDRRILIRFSLSDVPKETRVASAKLWMFYAGKRAEPPRSATIEAYTVNQDWIVGTGQSNEVTGTDGQLAKPREATWAEARRGAQPWKEPGCSGATEDRDPTPVASATIAPTDPVGQWKSWDITSAAQTWVKSPEANHGLILQQAANADGAGGVLQFCSSEAFKEGADDYCGGRRVALRPILIVMPEQEK